MCGIAGFTGTINAEKLQSMLDTIAHRGPDGEGTLKKPGVSLGMRRLAIIDPESGWQPIWNEDETVAIVFNGEIYNYAELRDELVKLGHTFTTHHSDTETIVHAYEQWGNDCVKKLRGMFAFAIWDSHKNKLFIARDRLGIKPLYYTIHDGRIIFASELKAIVKTWPIDRKPDDLAVYRFLRYRVHDNDERTFFGAISRLLPAHYMEIDLDKPDQLTTTKYWQPEVNLEFSGTKSDKAYADEFREVFESTVRYHLITDVPLGVALSGGLDSSGIAAMAAKLIQEGSSDVHTSGLLTFSTIYPGETIDESSYIKLVADKIGATMHTVAPKSDDFWNEIDNWIYYQEEPTISTAPYAYYSMYRLASQHVKVMLSGNGGDELLAGYIPYFTAYISSARKYSKYLPLLRELVMGSDLYFKYAQQMVANKFKGSSSIMELLDKDFVNKSAQSYNYNFANSEHLNERLWQDVSQFSIPNLTRYDDRNSMAFSIESRPPFLDHVLVEYIMKLPVDQKIKFGWNRHIYRQAMKGILPEEVRKRRSKIGFTNPELSWLRQHSDKFFEIFSSEPFTSLPYWDAGAVQQALQQVVKGEYKGDMLNLWRILNVALWYKQFCA